MTDQKYQQTVDYIISNQEKLYRIAYSYVHNKDGALDIVQNAICKALENYSSLRNMQFIGTWIYRIVVNESINYIRKNKRELPTEKDELEKDLYYEMECESGDLYDKVNKLPLDIQTVIKLRFYEDLSLKEISDITKVNLNTVKSRLYNGLKKLKTNMEVI